MTPLQDRSHVFIIPLNTGSLNRNYYVDAHCEPHHFDGFNERKNAVSPLLTHWRNCSLELRHQFACLRYVRYQWQWSWLTIIHCIWNYLSRRWPKYMTPYGVTGPQWIYSHVHIKCDTIHKCVAQHCIAVMPHGRSGVSNHQQLDYLPNSLFIPISNGKSASLALCKGNHRSPVESHQEGPVMCFYLWWRHHGKLGPSFTRSWYLLLYTYPIDPFMDHFID